MQIVNCLLLPVLLCNSSYIALDLLLSSKTVILPIIDHLYEDMHVIVLPKFSFIGEIESWFCLHGYLLIL